MFLELLLAASLAAQTADVPPASEAAVDAFVASIPQESDEPREEGEDPSEKQELARLEGLNAGREADVRQSFAAFVQCADQGSEKAVVESLRSSARRLGEEKLARLTAFYKSPDYAIYAAFADRIPDRLTTAEQKELDRINASYPLDDYVRSVEQSLVVMLSEDGLFGALSKCHQALEADLARKGLKS